MSPHAIVRGTSISTVISFHALHYSHRTIQYWKTCTLESTVVFSQEQITHCNNRKPGSWLHYATNIDYTGLWVLGLWPAYM
jgi:hypothetical protein